MVLSGGCNECPEAPFARVSPCGRPALYTLAYSGLQKLRLSIVGCLIVPEVVVGDPSTGPLFHQQCVVAANLETLPVNHIHFASFTYFSNVAYFHIFLIFAYIPSSTNSVLFLPISRPSLISHSHHQSTRSIAKPS